MSKRLILILALAFVVGIAFTAYAEVQNVKVSGDITVKGVARDDLDLAKSPVSGAAITSTTYQDKARDMLSIVRVRIDADLTDNVTTTIRLLNERNWGTTNATTPNNNIAPANAGFGGDWEKTQNIDLDLAYVTLKEFLYSPLSLTVGRQELRFGNALIVGDPDTNIYSADTSLAEGDLSARKSFDALRATLDYDPLVVDLVYAKVQEGNVNLNDDTTLAGLNATYALNKATTLEGFLFSKTRGTDAAAAMNVSGSATSFINDGTNTPLQNSRIKDRTDRVYAVGTRVVNKSIKNLSLDGQVAYQFGTYNPKFDPNARDVNDPYLNRQTAKRSAWALQAEATYDLKDVPVLSKYVSKYSPSITGNYTYLSGSDRDQSGNKAYTGWDPMFEDQTYGHLMNAIIASTNMHRAALSGKAKLTDDISAKLDYTMAWFAKRYPEGRVTVLSGLASNAATARRFIMGKTSFIGQEIDATLTYDYTEDVQFSLLGGVFMPGKSINERDGVNNPNRAAATELIGSMKVTF